MQKTPVPLEIKQVEGREFVGHGSVFRNIDQGGDIVVPGAFKRSLKEHKDAGSLPAMLWMHDATRIPGKWTSMAEDDQGLMVKGVLADTELGNEVYTLLKMEAVRGLSIGFVTRDYDYDKAGNRRIKDADLWEVSVVTFPMNPLAQVQHVKSRLSAVGEYVPTAREFERILRDVGCSKSVSKQLIHLWMEAKEIPVERTETPQCEAETDDIDKALGSLADKIMAAAIKSALKL